ncbi:MAG TPA: hypothetical protein VJR89_00345 [Polyangiales bacterium]|nr:hypothetical protein [Polyangiales bacterium]
MRHLTACSFALVLPLMAAGCGGATFRGGVYADEYTRYRVGALDAAWQPVEASGNDLAFYRHGMGTISVNSTCRQYDDVPLSALVRQLLFDTTERKVQLEETVTLVGRGAQHVIVDLELDGVPLQLELFVTRKDGCVFDLSHVRARAADPDARRQFLAFVHDFDVLEVKRP